MIFDDVIMHFIYTPFFIQQRTIRCFANPEIIIQAELETSNRDKNNDNHTMESEVNDVHKMMIIITNMEIIVYFVS